MGKKSAHNGLGMPGPGSGAVGKQGKDVMMGIKPKGEGIRGGGGGGGEGITKKKKKKASVVGVGGGGVFGGEGGFKQTMFNGEGGKQGGGQKKNGGKDKVGHKAAEIGGVGSDGKRAPFVDLSREVLAAGSNSKDVAERLFAMIIHPISVEEFYNDYYEKKPLLVKRNNRHYYDDWMKMSHVKQLIDTDELDWTYEVDVTSYKGGVRETHNGEGAASSSEIWKRHKEQGCSVRLLRPQKRLDHICLMLSLLEEHWGSGAGANVYLTPAHHQGFAPHWDDIEAFILQTEGTKRWRVYGPRNKREEMPRFSSRNFEQSEVSEPILETEVDAGDLLYFPRGFIHQAVSGAKKHSLHVTVSFGYRNSWYDYAKEVMDAALEEARKHTVGLRHSMPRDYLEYMGCMHASSSDARRDAVKETTKALIKQALSSLDTALDVGADARARTLLKERLPISLAAEGQGQDEEDEEWGAAAERVALQSHIRAVRGEVARLQEEGNLSVLYNCVRNSREYHGAEEQGLEFDPVYADAIEGLLKAYPSSIRVKKLAGDLDDEEKLDLARVLVSNGLAVEHKPKP